MSAASSILITFSSPSTRSIIICLLMSSILIRDFMMIPFSFRYFLIAGLPLKDDT